MGENQTEVIFDFLYIPNDFTKKILGLFNIYKDIVKLNIWMLLHKFFVHLKTTVGLSLELFFNCCWFNEQCQYSHYLVRQAALLAVNARKIVRFYFLNFKLIIGNLMIHTDHGLRTPREEIVFTARPKFNPNPKFLGTAEA